MFYFSHLVVIVMLLSLEVVLSRWLGVATPHLILATLLPLCLLGKKGHILFYAIVGGIALDLLPGALVGFHLLTFSLVVVTVTFLRESFFNQPSPALSFFLFFIVTLLFEVALALIFSVVHWTVLLPAFVTTICAFGVQALILRSGSRREGFAHA